MASQSNQNQGGTIDLRTMQGSTDGGAQSGAGSGQSSGQMSGDDQPISKFDIPELVKQQYPDLIPLILQTESMNDDERQYWFQILPIMTDEQVKKLRDILVNEKKQLTELDKQYQSELKNINDKHVAEWKAFEAKEKREKLQAAEKKAESVEKTSEEELLKKLQQL